MLMRMYKLTKQNFDIIFVYGLDYISIS